MWGSVVLLRKRRARRAGDEDAGHAGGGGRLDSGARILEDEALFRRNSKAAGCFEERIRVGFSAEVIFAADNCLEEVGDAERLQRVEHDAAMATAGDSQRLAAVPLAPLR